MDNFWQYFFGFLTAAFTGVLAILGQWLLNKQQTRKLEEKVDAVGSRVAVTVSSASERTEGVMKTSGNEVKEQIEKLSNGGPEGLKAQVREVLHELVESEHIEEVEQSCPFIKKINDSMKRAKARYDKETDVARILPMKENLL